MTPSRPSVLKASGRRLFSSEDAAALTVAREMSRKLTSAMAEPEADAQADKRVAGDHADDEGDDAHQQATNTVRRATVEICGSEKLGEEIDHQCVRLPEPSANPPGRSSRAMAAGAGATRTCGSGAPCSPRRQRSRPPGRSTWRWGCCASQASMAKPMPRATADHERRTPSRWPGGRRPSAGACPPRPLARRASLRGQVPCIAWAGLRSLGVPGARTDCNHGRCPFIGTDWEREAHTTIFASAPCTRQNEPDRSDYLRSARDPGATGGT